MIKIKLTLILLAVLIFSVNAQVSTLSIESKDNHELTVFVIRSASPLNWNSPATLYKTYKKSVLTNFMKKERTLKGHFFIRLSTPLIAEPLYAGITSANRNEEKKWMFIDKIGLGVLGVRMKGTVQGKDALLRKLEVHVRKNDIAYIKIKLSQTAAQRIIDFYKIYTTDFVTDFSQSDFYGGAFYPRFENEGAGCSSFAMAVLDLAGVNDIETSEWYKKINIPIELIGGEMNGHRKIKVREIKNTLSWNDGSGTENIDFVTYLMCDPSTAYYWILDHRKDENAFKHPSYQAETENDIPGLFSDRSNFEIDTLQPIIIERPDKNFFVDYHLKQFRRLMESRDSVLLTDENAFKNFTKNSNMKNDD